MEFVGLALNHAVDVIVDDDGKFVGEARIVSTAVRRQGRHHVARAVLVLQALALGGVWRLRRRDAPVAQPRLELLHQEQGALRPAVADDDVDRLEPLGGFDRIVSVELSQRPGARLPPAPGASWPA